MAKLFILYKRVFEYRVLKWQTLYKRKLIYCWRLHVLKVKIISEMTWEFYNYHMTIRAHKYFEFQDKNVNLWLCFNRWFIGLTSLPFTSVHTKYLPLIDNTFTWLTNPITYIVCILKGIFRIILWILFNKTLIVCNTLLCDKHSVKNSSWYQMVA